MKLKMVLNWWLVLLVIGISVLPTVASLQGTRSVVIDSWFNRTELTFENGLKTEFQDGSLTISPQCEGSDLTLLCYNGSDQRVLHCLAATLYPQYPGRNRSKEDYYGLRCNAPNFHFYRLDIVVIDDGGGLLLASLNETARWDLVMVDTEGRVHKYDVDSYIVAASKPPYSYIKYGPTLRQTNSSSYRYEKAAAA